MDGLTEAEAYARLLKHGRNEIPEKQKERGCFESKSKDNESLANLKDALKPVATVKRDGEWKTIDQALLVPGDIVRLVYGIQVPADLKVGINFLISILTEIAALLCLFP